MNMNSKKSIMVMVRKASAQKNAGRFAPEKKEILQEKTVAEIDM